MEEGLTVKETAVHTGLSAHTLRYYERVGLLDSVGRAESGHRRYSEPDLARIGFLGKLRATGMPIRKMKRFADLWRAGDTTIPQRRSLLEGHRDEVRRHLAELESNLRAIDEKVDLYTDMEANIDAATRPDGTGADAPRTGAS